MLDPAGHFSHTACWESVPRIAAWLRANFPHTPTDHGDGAYIYFVDRISALLRNQGRTPMLWDDPYRWSNTTLAPDAIVQAYRAKDACEHAADGGHRVVFSPMGAW